MKILFQASLVETDTAESLEYFQEDLALEPDVLQFAQELVQGARLHGSEIDRSLKKFIQKWDLDRVGNVEKAILRLAAFELLYRTDIPSNVTINEAVELCKEFSTESSSKFINGVLDKLARVQSETTAE